MVVLVSMPHENPYKNGLDSIDIPCYRKTLEKRFPISFLAPSRATFVILSLSLPTGATRISMVPFGRALRVNPDPG
jgi:hypothetical protein